MENITAKDENMKQETLLLKSDGTAEKIEQKKKSKVGRMLTSQEESILLPLIQGLLASGSNETSEKSKHENTPFPEGENASPKNGDADDTCQGAATKSMYTYAISILTSTQIINLKDITSLYNFQNVSFFDSS